VCVLGRNRRASGCTCCRTRLVASGSNSKESAAVHVNAQEEKRRLRRKEPKKWQCSSRNGGYIPAGSGVHDEQSGIREMPLVKRASEFVTPVVRAPPSSQRRRYQRNRLPNMVATTRLRPVRTHQRPRPTIAMFTRRAPCVLRSTTLAGRNRLFNTTSAHVAPRRPGVTAGRMSAA